MGHTGISTSSAQLAWLGLETGGSPKHSVFAACEMLGRFPIQSHLHSSHGMNLQFSACRNSVTKLSTNVLHCTRNLIRWLPTMKTHNLAKENVISALRSMVSITTSRSELNSNIIIKKIFCSSLLEYNAKLTAKVSLLKSCLRELILSENSLKNILCIDSSK